MFLGKILKENPDISGGIMLYINKYGVGFEILDLDKNMQIKMLSWLISHLCDEPNGLVIEVGGHIKPIKSEK